MIKLMCVFPHRDGATNWEPGMTREVDRELAGILLAGTTSGLKVWEKLGEIPLVHDELPKPLSNSIDVKPELESAELSPGVQVAVPTKKNK